jgi:hypothetical protein
LTTLHVTHDPREVASLAGRVLRLDSPKDREPLPRAVEGLA